MGINELMLAVTTSGMPQIDVKDLPSTGRDLCIVYQTGLEETYDFGSKVRESTLKEDNAFYRTSTTEDSLRIPRLRDVWGDSCDEGSFPCVGDDQSSTIVTGYGQTYQEALEFALTYGSRKIFRGWMSSEENRLMQEVSEGVFIPISSETTINMSGIATIHAYEVIDVQEPSTRRSGFLGLFGDQVSTGYELAVAYTPGISDQCPEMSQQAIDTLGN